jgi:uncharacterized membrane protein YgcG
MNRREIQDAQMGDDRAVQDSVSQWNLHAEAARRVIGGPGAFTTSGGVQFSRASVDDSHDTVKVRNDTGNALERGWVVGFGEPAYPPEAGDDRPLKFMREVALIIAVPEKGKFGILLDAIPIDGWGEAIIVGDAVCKIYLADASARTAAKYADADPTNAQRLLPGAGPAQVLHVQELEEYPGDAWAYVRLGAGLSLVPFKLTESLYPLGTAEAVILLDPGDESSSDDSCPTGEEIVVRDRIDIMYGQTNPETGEPRVSAEPDTCGFAQKNGDEYDIVALGGVCCGEDSSSSEESSSSEDSSSSSPDSSSSNDSHSDSSSPSSGGSSSGGSNSGSGSGDSSSSKSTAIVQSSLSPTGFVKWYIREGTGVFFDDHKTIIATQPKMIVQIDPIVVESTERGTLKVIGSPEQAVLCGIRVIGNEVHVLTPEASEANPVTVNMLITGIRRTFRRTRLEWATQADYDRNEAWLHQGVNGRGAEEAKP